MILKPESWYIMRNGKLCYVYIIMFDGMAAGWDEDNVVLFWQMDGHKYLDIVHEHDIVGGFFNEPNS